MKAGGVHCGLPCLGSSGKGMWVGDSYASYRPGLHRSPAGGSCGVAEKEHMSLALLQPSCHQEECLLREKARPRKEKFREKVKVRKKADVEVMV